MFRILGKEGTNARTPGTFFKSVAQATLLFGSETWVATPCIGRTLEGFHNWDARKLTRTKPHRQTNGIWVCPFPRRGSGGDGTGAGRGVYHSTPEYGRSVYCDAADPGDLHGGGEDGRIKYIGMVS